MGFLDSAYAWVQSVFTGSSTGYLNHSLIPEKCSQVGTTRENLVTEADTRNYAVCGFHASVTAGLAASGKVRAAWGTAAQAYKAVYQQVVENQVGPMDLKTADALADKARAMSAGPAISDGSGKGSETDTLPPVQAAGLMGTGIPTWAAVGAGGAILFLWANRNKKGGRRRSTGRRRPTSRRRVTRRRRRR